MSDHFASGPRSSRPRNYREWNQSIARYFFNPTRAGEIVHLTVDEETLRIIGHHQSRDEAVNHFTECVKTQLSITGWNADECLVRPGDPQWEDWVPQSIGLLAFQVLVAFKMLWDDVFTSRNFWGRLANELGQSDCEMPKGLSLRTHGDLWRFSVGGWANSRHYRRGEWGELYLPPDQPRASDRWIRLPLSQTLLRREDRFRLPQFFFEAGLRAGESVENDYLSQMIQKRPDLTGNWLPHAHRVLNDPYRREAALDQIAEDLQAWNGSVEGRESSATNRVRMWLTISRRGPKWVLTGSGLIKKTLDRYERSNATLENLLRDPNAQGFYGNLRMLSYEEMVPAYVEVRHITPGSQVVLVAQEDLLSHLQVTCGGVADSWTSLPIPLPPGWKAARISARASLQPSPPWDDLVACHSVRIRTVGGLKLSHCTWLAGSGPSIELVGDPVPDSFWVNGHEFPYIGGPTPCLLLQEPGVHSIWVPHRRRQARTVRVEEPCLVAHYVTPAWSLGPDWPGLARLSESHSIPYLHGNVLVGDVVEVEEAPLLEPALSSVHTGPAAQPSGEPLLVKLILGLKRNAWLLSQDDWQSCAHHPHPLVRALYPPALSQWRQLQGQEAR